jgi:Domain of unknown function (DUF4157)
MTRAHATAPLRPRDVGDGGTPAPSSVRVPLEQQLRTPLDNVRIHDSPAAHNFARSHDANAVTVGNDIYFGRNRFHPTAPEGRELLTHELVHVAQQGSPDPSASDGGGNAVAAAEREAQHLAGRVRSSTSPVQVRQSLPRNSAPLRDARTLKAAIEDELDDFFVGIDNTWPQIRREPQVERDKVRTDQPLERAIRREVDPMELLKTYLLLTNQTEARFPAHYTEFVDATDRAGTHEARVFAVLRGVSQAERSQMKAMPGVVEVIKDEMSGSELRNAMNLLDGVAVLEGQSLTPVTASVRLEASERYVLNVQTGASLETVESNLEDATSEYNSNIILGDTALWSKLRDEFDPEEMWYLRMITRYEGKEKFPRLTGPNAGTRSFLFAIWEAVKITGTDEDALLGQLAAARTAPGITGARQPNALVELRDDPWFLPMLNEELSGDDLRQALNSVGGGAPPPAGIRRNVVDAIDNKNLPQVRKLLKDPKLSPADLRKLETDPEVIKEMGDELRGSAMCETALLLRFGGAQLPLHAEELLKLFQAKPVDVPKAVLFLQSLAPTAGALRALRALPGIYLMLTDSGLNDAETSAVLGAINFDRPEYQEKGSEGKYRTATNPAASRLPVAFTSSEVRIPIRCNIDTSRMRGTEGFNAKVVEDWQRSIDSVWNGKFLVRSGAHSLSLVFAPYMAVGVTNPNIRMFVHDWKNRSRVRAVWDATSSAFVRGEMDVFLDDLEPIVLAHEFGHVFGNPDEYALTAGEYQRITGTPGPDPKAAGGQTAPSVMGNQYETPVPEVRHAAPALQVINAVRDVARYPAPFVLVKR